MSLDKERIVNADALRDLMERILTAAGCSHEQSMATADVLIEADLRGYSTHGLIRLPNMIRRIQSGMINANARPHVVHEREGSALVEGDRAMGPVGATYGASLAARKAEKAGSCAVGVVNSDHICMTGYYAERIARAGCVGIVAGVTQPLVHPFGGVERLMGTNPFSIAVPKGGDEPVLLDFATSAIPYGMILKASVTGEPIPEGVAVGPDGEPTTDAKTAASGAVAPFGGHKGYGLCLLIGLLAGPLLGAKVGKPLSQSVQEGHYDKGDLFIAIDPSAFGDPKVFREMVDFHVAEVKNTRKAPGVEEIRVPGERSFREKERRLREGILVDDGVWKQVGQISDELKVAMPV